MRYPELVLNSPETLVVGRRGRLARAFHYLAPCASVVGSRECDIANRDCVLGTVERMAPKVIVNCAAITDLRRCERDPDGTRSVNVEGVSHLANAARSVGALLIHFSSDYALNPVNEYGRQKLDSERFADLTIRAKIYDGSHWALQAMRNRVPVRMTTCEYSNPVSVTTLIGLLKAILERRLRGIFAVGTRDRLSLFEVGRVWAVAIGAPVDLVQPCEEVISDYRRPVDTFMMLAKLIEAGVDIPTLAEDVTMHWHCFREYGLPNELGV